MRIAEIITDPRPTPFWAMLKQVGVTEVVGVLPRQYADWRRTAIDEPWNYTPLALYQELLAEEGLRLTAIEDNPPMDKIRYGAAGAEEELEQVLTLIRNMGKLGIDVWCYHWMAGLGWIRTSSRLRTRGGAIVSGYDHRLLADVPPPRLGPIDRETLWKNLERFLMRVVPVAEKAGVKLAMHPDDPPVWPEIRGVARIMSQVDSLERLLSLVPSDANGITLCQGNVTLMTDDLPRVIRQLGASGRVFFVHFRDVRGDPAHFEEAFIDDGKTDMLACLRAYRDVGFTGIMRCDHTPTLTGDDAEVPGYSVLGRLHAIGYMTALREAVMAEASSPGVLPAVGVRGVRHLSEITAVAEGLDHPECVTVGPDGILWAGGEAGQIYRIDPEARQWTQVGGTGGRCLGLTIDGREQLWICDVGRQALLCWDMARRAVVREIQEVEGIPLVNPNFAVFGDDGTLYVSDSGHFGQNDGFLFAVAPDGTSRVVDRRPCHFPNGLALSADGRTLYIAESTEPAVSTLQLDTFDYRWLCRLPGTVPDGLALTENGTVFVSCYRPDAIYRVDPDGTASLYATDPAGTTLAAPTNIVFAGSHRDMLYIASLGRWHIGCLSMPERGIALRYPR